MFSNKVERRRAQLKITEFKQKFKFSDEKPGLIKKTVKISFER